MNSWRSCSQQSGCTGLRQEASCFGESSSKLPRRSAETAGTVPSSPSVKYRTMESWQPTITRIQSFDLAPHIADSWFCASASHHRRDRCGSSVATRNTTLRGARPGLISHTPTQRRRSSPARAQTTGKGWANVGLVSWDVLPGGPILACTRPILVADRSGDARQGWESPGACL